MSSTMKNPNRVKKSPYVAKAINPNAGWPLGLKRAEYREWKAYWHAKGVTEKLTPMECARQKQAGLF